jgi:hypothetical protein
MTVTDGAMALGSPDHLPALLAHQLLSDIRVGKLAHQTRFLILG